MCMIPVEVAGVGAEIWGLGADVVFSFQGLRGDVRLESGAQGGAVRLSRGTEGYLKGPRRRAGDADGGWLGQGEGKEAGAEVCVPRLGGIRRGRAAGGVAAPEGRGGAEWLEPGCWAAPPSPSPNRAGRLHLPSSPHPAPGAAAAATPPPPRAAP